MHPYGIHYFPLTLPFLLILLGLLAALSVLVLARVLRFAYSGLGISPGTFLLLMFLSLIGSSINIPIMQYPDAQVVSNQVVTFFGIPYVVPVVEHWPATILAINVGGAIIPIWLSLYLMAKNGLYAKAFWGIAIVSLACWWLAEPVPGVGIAIPVFYPPLVAALAALALSRVQAAPLAYVSGSIGTLIGGDLLNLDKIRGLGAPVASIGGAGTFDGIFVTGLLAVILAAAVSRHHTARSYR